MKWFAAVKCWPESSFELERVMAVAEELGWGLGYVVVEREMLFYDTMWAFLTLFPAELVAGGGSILNRLFVTGSPRFSFDLDTTTLEPVSSKRELVAPLLELNAKLSERGMAVTFDVAGVELKLGEVVVDIGKDVLPDILSLKRVMPARLVGTPLPKYLESRYGVDTAAHPASSEMVRLKDELGFLPKVEEVRIEVGLARRGFRGEWREENVKSFLEPIAAPTCKVRCKVSTAEYSAALKLSSLSRPYSRELLPDLVRDVCDLRMLERGVDRERVVAFAREEGADFAEALRTLELVEAEGRELFESSWHFTLVRRELGWGKLCSLVRKEVRALAKLASERSKA